jgi:hypothetical protein
VIPYPFSATDHRYPIKAYIDGLLTANEDVILYVDPVTGSDSNTGTQAAPLRTLDFALTKIPYYWTGKCRIFLANGSHTISTPISVGGPIGPTAEPFYIAGTMKDVGIGTQTSGAGGTTTSVNGATGLTVDAYRGKRLRVLTGARAGQTRHVVSNTATTFTLYSALSGGALANGDTYVIEEPGAIITPNIASGLFAVTATRAGPDPTGYSVGFYGIRWTFAANTNQFYILGGSTFVGFDSCEFNANGISAAQINLAYFGAMGMQTIPHDVSNSSASSGACYWYGGITNGSSVIRVDNGRTSTLRLVGDDLFISFNNAVGTLSTPNLRRSPITATHSDLTIQSGSTLDGLNLVGPLLRVSASTLRLSTSTNVWSNSTTDAFVADNSDVNIATETTTPAAAAVITGTGNAGYGIHLIRKSTATLGAGTTVTGTSGDIIVGATVSTHANLTAAGFVTDANYLSRVSRTGA